MKKNQGMTKEEMIKKSAWLGQFVAFHQIGEYSFVEYRSTVFEGCSPVVPRISPKDCIVLDKCNTVDKEFYFILKHPNGKTSRVQVTEKEYLNTYRGEVFNEPKPSSSDQKMAVIMTVSESKVNDMLISKGK